MVIGKDCFYGGVAGLAEWRPNLWGCVWLAVVAGLLIGHSGCRAGQRGDAGASPDGLRVAVGVLVDEGFEDVQNLLLLAAGHLGDSFKQLAGATAGRNDALGA